MLSTSEVVSALPKAVEAALGTTLDGAARDVLERMTRSAREESPSANVGEEAWVQSVAATLADSAPAEYAHRLAELHGTDLWLACGAAHGVPAAVAAVDALLGPAVDRVRRRFAFDAAEAEELHQRLRVLLLVDEPDKRPRILQYGGRGSLAGWLRTVAVRHALNMRKRTRRHEPLENAEALMLSIPHLHHARQEQRAAFVPRLRAAFFELSVRERTVLRLHLVDGLSLTAVSRAYNVHRSTASRWVAAACEQLAAALMGRLETVDVSRAERDIVSAVRSRLEISLRDVLESTSSA